MWGIIKKQGFTLINSDLDSCALERRADGVYITYTPPGGADSVTRKLGEPALECVHKSQAAAASSFSVSVNAVSTGRVYIIGRVNMTYTAKGSVSVNDEVVQSYTYNDSGNTYAGIDIFYTIDVQAGDKITMTAARAVSGGDVAGHLSIAYPVD